MRSAPADVYKRQSSSWCEDQDFYRFSGIFRSVYLYTMPKVHVYDLKVQPVVDEAVLNADLLVTMQMRGEGKACLLYTSYFPAGNQCLPCDKLCEIFKKRKVFAT